MQEFILGTAGHIDHGKTSLVKALTAIDCDTHPEEQRRGITINPGFAYLCEGDRTLAFVDVPGHQKFINNMVAGASGVDFVLLVIAADDGVMPQTREHLKICSLLGITAGITVLNKCDAVSSDEVALCREEIAEFLQGTFLEHAPIFEVSALKGTGIESLKHYLLTENYAVSTRQRHDYFRMPIDRVFNVAGFGAVVTGTVAGGTVMEQDRVTLLPAELECRIRSMQRHRQAVSQACQGVRLAADLAGVKCEQVAPGDVLCALVPIRTTLVDAQVTVIADDELPRRFSAVMLAYTHKMQVKVHLLGMQHGQATIQIEYSDPWYFAVGDYFILRSTDADATLAGGRIIDPQPLTHRKTPEKLHHSLSEAATGALPYLLYKVSERVRLYDTTYFSQALQSTPERIDRWVESEPLLYPLRWKGRTVLLNRADYEAFTQAIVEGFRKYYRANPLSVTGIERSQMLEFADSVMFASIPAENDDARDAAADALENQGVIARTEHRMRLADHRVELSENEKSRIEAISRLVDAAQGAPLEEQELYYSAESLKISQKEALFILRYLMAQGKITRMGDCVIESGALRHYRQCALEFLNSHPEGMRASDFRQLSGLNRRSAILVLEFLDREKFFVRDGDLRFASVRP